MTYIDGQYIYHIPESMMQKDKPKNTNKYNVWHGGDGIYQPDHLDDGIPPLKELPPGLYEYECDPEWRGTWVKRVADEFTFQHEIYKVDNFIDCILESYKKRNLSTGVLFNGRPGTGKTVHAKMLANASGLPIIYVAQEPDRLFTNFLSRITQPICWVFDEFEKYVGRNETAMLSILDGVFRNEVPHLFIFTTNTLEINDRFIGRPSRIRYIKTFDTLPRDFFEKYIKGNLKDPQYFNDIMEYVKDNLTMDVVKSVVEEVNAIGFNKEILDTVNIKHN